MPAAAPGPAPIAPEATLVDHRFGPGHERRSRARRASRCSAGAPRLAPIGSALAEAARAEYHYVGRDLRNMAVLVVITDLLWRGRLRVPRHRDSDPAMSSLPIGSMRS